MELLSSHCLEIVTQQGKFFRVDLNRHMKLSSIKNWALETVLTYFHSVLSLIAQNPTQLLNKVAALYCLH